MTRVGWYVHHHGHGHLTRLLTVRAQLDAEVTVFSSMPEPESLPPATTWVSLPRDDHRFSRRAGLAVAAGSGADTTEVDAAEVDAVDPAGADPTAGGLLHWAPLGHPGHRRRLTMIADACTDQSIDAFVVDVSVEVTLWARLLGLPTVVFAQPGERTDLPHELAYRAADRVIAPWPDGLIASSALDAVRGRVVWVGGVSRFDGRRRGTASRERTVLVLGSVFASDEVAAARRMLATAGWNATFAGADAGTWRADPWDLITTSTVVISAAGQNSVADLAAADARAVVVAQPRPFGEQHAMAAALDRAGLAVVADGRIAALPDAMDAASALQPAWRVWQVEGAAARAAAVIASVVR